MKDQNLKGKVVTLNIVQKAMTAIENVVPAAQVALDVDSNIVGQLDLLKQYEQTVAELNELYDKNKMVLIRISELYVHAERLRRVIKPKIYINAYLENRNFTHIYINANCGYVNQKGKVENVVAFMGKSSEDSVEKAQAKIAEDQQMALEAKRLIVEKLIKKLANTHVLNNSQQENPVIHIEFDASKNNVIQLMQLFLAKNQGFKQAGAQVNEQSQLEQAMVLMEDLLKEIDLKVK